MNLYQRVLYLILFIKECFLTFSVSKRVKTSFENSTSKTVIGKAATLDIKSATVNNIELVKQEMTILVNKSKYSSDVLTDYVKENGIKIVFIKDVSKFLNLLGEEQGFITERIGFDGFIINLLTGCGISHKSKPVVILEKDNKDFYYLLFSVYKLCGYLHKLPGYDYNSQKLFKIYSKNAQNADVSKLSIEQTSSLKEAVMRDNEASKFVIEVAKIKDNSPTVANN